MTKRVVLVCFVVSCAAAGALNLSAHSDDPVAYPIGYRKWVEVKSVPEPRGIHHIYANDKAIEGYHTGKFPDGSVIVFDLLELRDVAGKKTEGARKLVDLMIKDSRRFTATGGWAFEEFKGDSETDRTLTAQGKTDCYNCHAGQKNNDYVFSRVSK